MDVIKLSTAPSCPKFGWMLAVDPRGSRRKGILHIAHDILNQDTPPSPSPFKGQAILRFSNPPILKALFGLGGGREAQTIRPPIRRMSDGVLDLCLPGIILLKASWPGVRITRRGKLLLDVVFYDFSVYHVSLKMAFSGGPPDLKINSKLPFSTQSTLPGPFVRRLMVLTWLSSLL